MTVISWLHAPGHAGSIRTGVITFALGHDPLIVDWSEMYWNIDELRNFKAYNHFIGQPKRRDSRNRVVNHDVVISTRNDARVVHDEEFFVSREIKENIKYNPERWGKARVIEFEGQIILIVAWHPQPKPIKKARLVYKSYRRGVARVQRIQRQLEQEYKPDLVLNGGDLQLGVGFTPIHPNKYANRNGMRWRRHRIDWQMFKGQLWKVFSFRKLDPSKINPKMDHVWSLLTLRKDGRK